MNGISLLFGMFITASIFFVINCIDEIWECKSGADDILERSKKQLQCFIFQG